MRRRFLGSTDGPSSQDWVEFLKQIRRFSEDAAFLLKWFDRVGYDVDIERTANDFGVRPTRLRAWAAAQSWT